MLAFPLRTLCEGEDRRRCAHTSIYTPVVRPHANLAFSLSAPYPFQRKISNPSNIRHSRLLTTVFDSLNSPFLRDLPTDLVFADLQLVLRITQTTSNVRTTSHRTSTIPFLSSAGATLQAPSTQVKPQTSNNIFSAAGGIYLKWSRPSGFSLQVNEACLDASPSFLDGHFPDTRMAGATARIHGL